MFKYPHTDFEKINLDWILRKIKQLEPAIPIVEESAAIVARVEQTANDAAQAAQSAQTAVATVTAVAQEAKDTAEEAKEIAQQAASATIADGSVVWAKLGTDVQQVITGNTDRSTTAATNAALAQTAATTAQQTADTAQTTATAAQTTANSAKTAATAAQQTATAAQQTATAAQQTANTVINWTWIATLRTNNQSAQIPVTAKEVLLEAFNFNLSPRLLCSMMFEVGILNVDSAINFNLVEQELYCVINSNKQVIFDPNETHTGDIRLRVCYR